MGCTKYISLHHSRPDRLTFRVLQVVYIYSYMYSCDFLPLERPRCVLSILRPKFPSLRAAVFSHGEFA